ncbi:MAG: hypothetical protein KAI24_11825 [Planctomycetes bacterium]|nr:hypothetical protein [Planctomycetota bacterium]
MSDPNRIDPAVGAIAPPQPPQPNPSATESSPRFQELLERLQKITAEQPEADDVDGPETLRDALRTADDGFVAAMDLRRQLEEAFRKHMS